MSTKVLISSSELLELSKNDPNFQIVGTRTAVEQFLQNTRPWATNYGHNKDYQCSSQLTVEALQNYYANTRQLTESLPRILAAAETKTYRELGVDGKALWLYIQTGRDRLAKEKGKTLAQVYSAWSKDLTAREPVSYTLSQLYNIYMVQERKKNKNFEAPACHFAIEEEAALVIDISKRLNEIENLDKSGKLPQLSSESFMTAPELLAAAKKVGPPRFYFNDEAEKKFLENQPRWYSQLKSAERGHQVQLLTFELFKKDYLEKQITNNIRNAKPIWITDAQTKTYKNQSIDARNVWRMMQVRDAFEKYEPSTPFAKIFNELERDFLEREAVAYTLKELGSYQQVLNSELSQKNIELKLAAEGDYAALTILAAALKYIQNQDSLLIRTRDRKTESEANAIRNKAEKEAREADYKRNQEAKKAAEKAKEEEKALKEAEAKAKKDADDKKAKEEIEAKASAQSAEALGSSLNKIALFQAEMAELVTKLQKAEIAAPDFQAQCAALQKKYF